MNFTLPLAGLDENFTAAGQLICNCTGYKEAYATLGAQSGWMAIVAFAVVLWMAIMYKRNPEKVQKNLKWCIFLLLITIFWIMEVTIHGFIAGII